MAKDSTSTILLLGAVGVAVYGYTQGWFNNLLSGLNIGTSSTAPTAAQLAAAQAAAAAAAASAAASQSGSSSGAPPTPPPVPPLGTTVTNTSDALRQVAANDAYIIPDAATFAVLQTALPAGYNFVSTTDKGSVLLRPDVYAAVNKLISDRATRAASQGAAAASVQAAGQTNIREIQQVMGNAGLSGLGDFARHMFTRTGRAG